MSKFTWPAVLFLIVLATAGFDRLSRRRYADGCFVVSVDVAVGVLLAAGLGVYLVDWQAMMQRVLATGASYLAPAAYAQPEFVAQALFAARAAVRPLPCSSAPVRRAQ